MSSPRSTTSRSPDETRTQDSVHGSSQYGAVGALEDTASSVHQGREIQTVTRVSGGPTPQQRVFAWSGGGTITFGVTPTTSDSLPHRFVHCTATRATGRTDGSNSCIRGGTRGGRNPSRSRAGGGNYCRSPLRSRRSREPRRSNGGGG